MEAADAASIYIKISPPIRARIFIHAGVKIFTNFFPHIGANNRDRIFPRAGSKIFTNIFLRIGAKIDSNYFPCISAKIFSCFRFEAH